jgi:hypothetical protein
MHFGGVPPQVTSVSPLQRHSVGHDHLGFVTASSATAASSTAAAPSAVANFNAPGWSGVFLVEDMEFRQADVNHFLFIESDFLGRGDGPQRLICC